MIAVEWIIYQAHLAAANHPLCTKRSPRASVGKSNSTDAIFRLQVVKTAKIRQFFGFSRQSLNPAAGKPGFPVYSMCHGTSNVGSQSCRKSIPPGRWPRCPPRPATADFSSHFPIQKWLNMWSSRSSVYTSPRTICSSRNVWRSSREINSSPRRSTAACRACVRHV